MPTPETKTVLGEIALEICENQLRHDGFPSLEQMKQVSMKTGIHINDVKGFYWNLLPRFVQETFEYSKVTIDMEGPKG